MTERTHETENRPRILIVGGGYVGMYAAPRRGFGGESRAHKGVAEVYGVKLRGLPAWFMHRAYHLGQVPTLNHKVRIAADWALALFFGREVVSLGQVRHPRREWESAALMQASGPRPMQTPRAREREEGMRRHG